jgi:hypothetical protein
MDVLRLYQDYGIEHLTEGHKHCRPGWVNTQCPHCSGNEGMHLGWNTDENYYRCWRCGWHPPLKTLSLLLNLPTKQVIKIIADYGIVRSYIKKKPRNKKEFILPFGVSDMKDVHRKYLKGRGFSPDKLEKVWGVKGTGPLSYLDKIDYRFRLFIPIYWNGELVTFDTRDITGTAEGKYKACPTDREIIGRKQILYGNQEAWGDVGICVEGPFDVWKLGENAFAVSGIEYKQEQVKEIAKIFKKVAVVFDGAIDPGEEAQAKIQARKLVKDLQFRNVDAYSIQIKGDPGGMPSHEANSLVKKILGK